MPAEERRPNVTDATREDATEKQVTAVKVVTKNNK
jgi:hypothetical protein